jgi:hypothetical protein
MVDVIKRIIAEQGETILGDAPRLKGYIADYASRESKAERIAFRRCMEYGAYTELKDAEDKAARQAVKAAVAKRVHANEGLDIALCNNMFDALEAALFGEEKPKKARCLKCGRELEPGWIVCPFCGVGSAAPENTPPLAGGLIFVSGSDVYGTGSKNGKASYWKNGRIVSLSNSTTWISSIFVSGSDVYIAGSEDRKASYWKNGQAVRLSDRISNAGSIFISGSDVYVTGDEDSRAIYWKNDQAVMLGW